MARLHAAYDCAEAAHGANHRLSDRASPTSAERAHALPILVERPEGLHLDWVEVVGTTPRPVHRLTGATLRAFVGARR